MNTSMVGIVVVAIAIKIVGALLTIAFLIMPAAAARFYYRQSISQCANFLFPRVEITLLFKVESEPAP